MTNGIVVDHKESGVRYAISAKNFNEEVHTKVRDLNPGETVIGFTPLTKGSLSEVVGVSATPAPTPGAAGDPSDGSVAAGETPMGATSDNQAPKTEGSASAGTKGK